MSILIAFMSVLALAAPEDIKSRDALSEKARSRQYEGGMDEQPLEVQPSLVEPRKDGSETALQRKVLNSDGSETTEAAPVDETSGGF